MNLSIKKLQKENKDGSKRVNQSISGIGKFKNNNLTMESMNGSSLYLNGTSLEEIKEMTLNMQLPPS